MAWRYNQSPPESIKNVIDELFQTEILSKRQKEKMCSSEEFAIAADPNLEMKLRHQKAKERSHKMDSRRSFAKNEIISEAKRLISREELMAKEIQNKNRTYDRELKQFEMDLAKSTRIQKEFERYSTKIEKIRKFPKRSKSCSYVAINCSERVEPIQVKISNIKADTTKNIKIKQDRGNSIENQLSVQSGCKYDAAECIVDKQSTQLPPVCVEFSVETYKKNDMTINNHNDVKLEVPTLLHYWKLWRGVVNARKIHDRVQDEKINRIAKIDNFVSELSSQAASMKAKKKEKCNSCPYLPQTKIFTKLSKKSSNKKHSPESNPCDQVSLEKIVLQQKNKLQEQQKIINQLRLEQIKLATERSAQQAQIYLESSMQEVSLPTQRKLNYLKSTFPSILDRHYNKPKPNFLIQMEIRQKERQKRKAELREKTKIKILEQQKLREEKERIKREQLEEEKRIEHEIKIQKLKEQAHNRIQEQIATKFCQLRRLRLGFEAFKKALELRENQCLLAQNYFTIRNNQRVFRAWRSASNESVEKRLQAARHFYQCNILKNAWKSWKQIGVEVKQDRQVADDFHELIIVARIFQTWRSFTLIRYRSLCEDLDQARQFYERRVLARSLKVWRRLRETRDEERRVERKKEALRNSVRLILPDFNPSRNLPFFPTTGEPTFSHNSNFCTSSFELFVSK